MARCIKVTRYPRLWMVLLCVLVLVSETPSLRAQQAVPATKTEALQPILTYIAAGWGTLTRSLADCRTLVDERSLQKSVLYLPAEMAMPREVEAVQKKCGIQVRHLPAVIHAPGQLADAKISPQGLLYLPKPYVVPGGFFNEMYGWDSYFIILGLLRDNRLDLARDIVDNFLFEIEHYGAILNANRTYFLSRSQPPFLTSMIMAVHHAQAEAGRDDHEWLAHAYPLAVHDYEMWTRKPHLAGSTGLSRYFDLGQGPAPEIVDINDPYYYNVAKQFTLRPELNHGWLTAKADTSTPANWPRFSMYLCPQGTAPVSHCPLLERLAFTADYYKGDRSDRESGFDITFRFGPFGAATHHFAAVCLNSLLYKAEQDLSELSRLAGHQQDSDQWKQCAAQRRAAVDKYLWNAEAGMYFDYDIQHNRPSSYVYATMFYPLWAGMASAEQARRVEANLRRLERPGGLATSEVVTGVQWDLPYGWAPLQLLAVEGLRRYGFEEDANRLSFEFLSMVLENFQRDKTVREKYNVVTRSSEVNVTAGYRRNVVGFGWTNGVFLELLRRMPKEWQARLVSYAEKQLQP